MDKNASTLASYPQPLVVPPLRQPHKQSFIVLHGFGSDGKEIGTSFLSLPVSKYNSLAEAFPHARFVFPTASTRQMKGLGGMVTQSWFDTARPDEWDKYENLMIEGLHESTLFTHELIKTEAEAVGAENVVLGGFSQGSAQAYISLLLWTGQPLAAAFGLCGWLPFWKRLDGIARGHVADVHGSGSPNKARSIELISFLAQRLAVSYPSQDPFPLQMTPLFIGSGELDQRMPTKLAKEAASLLGNLDMKISVREFEGLGHSYSSEVLGDIVDFIYTKSSWTDEGLIEDSRGISSIRG